MEKYAPDIEQIMKLFYTNLSEKDKRHYAAVEVTKLGHGGMQYISNLFECSRQTISKGLEELQCNTLVKVGRVRAPGGGRKNHAQKHLNINAIFFKGN